MTLIDNYVNKTNANTPSIYLKITSSNSSMASVSPNSQVNVPNKHFSTLKDELVKEKKKNGLIEKFYNFSKNKTGFGIGSKKVDQKIIEFENGKTTEEEVKNKLSEYKISQENVAQNLGDLASGVVAISGYFGLSNLVKNLKARFETNALYPAIEAAPEQLKSKIKNLLNSNIKTKAIIIPILMLAGGMTKLWALKLNRIGSKEFKLENKQELDKKELKKAKKELNHKRHKLNLKNFYTGAINGLLAPVTAVAGGIVGIPAYILGTSGIRFLKSKNDNKDKFFKNYIDNLKNNAVLNSLFAVALAAPIIKNVRYSKVLEENLSKVIKKLKDVKLQKPDLPSNKTAYDELENIMLNSHKIKNILSGSSSDINEAVRKLTDENIFAVKFLQISNKGGELSSALIESCPPSRTIGEAQNEVNKLLNSDKYKVSKLLGVGTVAESYLAKDQSGKEVCIKILKNGINLEKIQRDKETFINLITKGVSKEQLTKSQQYLIKNIENLAEGISKEVDFENELKAAKKLSKSTKHANVVVPIEVKPGVYVMEKAPGISLDTLVKYYQYESVINYYKSQSKTGGSGPKYAEDVINQYTKKIEELKAKSPDFKDFDLSTNEINVLLKRYIDIMVEQFTKVDKNGKTLHADIHPGNIFINIDALKNKKGKLFTLIDTGNTIDLAKEESMAALKLTTFIKNGNVRDITKYVMKGAVLPQGMKQENAVKLVEQDLKTIFFNSKTKISSMNADELFRLTNNVLRKHDIIPNDLQLNLNKAKKSATNSLKGLIQSFFGKKYANLDNNDFNNKSEKVLKISNAVKDGMLLMEKLLRTQTWQETKNLSKMSLKEIINYFRNPNMLKTNSEEHFTYKFKQNIKLDSESDFG